MKSILHSKRVQQQQVAPFMSHLDHHLSDEKIKLSASLDGTVKAQDLLRHRHFRALLTPTPCQILSLATNAQSPIVVAGIFSEPRHVFLWNVANVQLIEVLSAHSDPITSFHFSANATNDLP